MRRIPPRALTAALAVPALLVAALVAPRGDALPTPSGDQVQVVTAVVGAAAAPRVRTPVPGRTAVVRHSRAERYCPAGLVALTFDDGPSASVTPGLVRTLKRLDVPATFFMVGSRVQALPEIARMVAREGFLVANHTWSHPALTALKERDVLRQLTRTRQEFLEQRIVASHLVRPPFGAHDARVRREIRSLGLTSVLWSNDSFDWRGGNPVQIANRVIAKLNRNGINVVLQHDGVRNSPSSARAVPLIVSRARAKGYCFAELGDDGRPAVPLPQVRARTVSGTEDGSTAVRVRLDLDRLTTRSTSVRVQAVSGSARAGSDFTPVTVRVTFPRGVRTAWFDVPVLDDGEAEPAEDVRVVLDRSVGLEVPDREVLATVLSED